MPEFYTYRFIAGNVASKIQGSTGLSPLVVSGLSVIETTLVFPAALLPSDRAALDGFMDDRGYTFKRQTQGEAIFHASTAIVGNEFVASPAWASVGGAVTNVAFFANVPAKVFGQIVGEFKTDGAGAEVRVVETNSAGVEVIIGQWAIPDTAGAWVMQRFTTTVAPRPADMTYRVEIKNGGAVASMRYTSLVLLENV
jgi:hypothetical protein